MAYFLIWLAWFVATGAATVVSVWVWDTYAMDDRGNYNWDTWKEVLFGFVVCGLMLVLFAGAIMGTVTLWRIAHGVEKVWR